MIKILLLAIFLFSIADRTFAQIEGIVIDKKNEALINAIIIVRDTTGKAIDTVKSDKRGAYAFKDLKPGKYIVEAKASGFQSATYKNIITTTPPKGTDPNDDTYYAVRLDIVLTPTKTPN